MPKFSRSVLLLLASLAGGQILALVTAGKPAASTDCLQWAQETINRYQAPQPAPGEPIGGYFDVRTQTDRPLYRQGEAPGVPAEKAEVPISGSLAANDYPVDYVQPAPAPAPALAPANDGSLSREQRLAGSMDMIGGAQ